MGKHDFFWTGRLAIRPNRSGSRRSPEGAVSAFTRYGDIREAMLIAARPFPHCR